MSSYGLMHSTAKYEVGNKKSLLSALKSLSNFDCDFNGENGIEYLSSEVWEANGYKSYKDYEAYCDSLDIEDDNYEEPVLKFESNQDYYCSIAETEDEEDAINNFLANWLDKDSYYREWNADVVTDGKIKFLSVAALTYC